MTIDCARFPIRRFPLYTYSMSSNQSFIRLGKAFEFYNFGFVHRIVDNSEENVRVTFWNALHFGCALGMIKDNLGKGILRCHEHTISGFSDIWWMEPQQPCPRGYFCYEIHFKIDDSPFNKLNSTNIHKRGIRHTLKLSKRLTQRF